MRIIGGILVVACLITGAATGCKSNSDASATPDPAAVKAQQELVARRDALLAQRDKLKTESQLIQAEIEKVEANGGDTSELAKKKAELDTQIQEQDTNLDSASTELTKLTSKLDAAGGVVAREARVAERERQIADRERQMADRERQLATRDAESSRRWAESCSTGTQTIIQQVAPPKSGTYNRKEVDRLMARARSQMAKKGLVSSDLGAQASLEREITKALGESDWSRGYVLAGQLVQTIDAIKIDRPFISAKYQRLHNRVKAAKVDNETQATLDTGMKEVMQKYGDGDFVGANRRINQLWGNLR